MVYGGVAVRGDLFGMNWQFGQRLLVLMLLASCGGGSGGSGTTAPTNFAVSPISDSDSAPNSVSEAAAIGSGVGITASASDRDASDSVSYSLIDDALGLFEIDTVSGLVTTAAALDFETATSHTIRIRASSSDGTSSEATFEILIEDDPDEPILSLSFPVSDSSAVFHYSGTDIDISGNVSDPLGEEVSVVVIAGSTTEVATIDIDGNWRASDIPVPQEGSPYVEMTIEARNESSKWTRYTIRLSTEPVLDSLAAIAIDPADDRAFVLDSGLRSIIAVDLATGERELVSGDTKGNGPDLYSARVLAVDVELNTAFTLVGSEFVAVDLTTGDRTVFSDSTPDFGPLPVSFVYDVDIDRVGNRLIVGSLDQLIAVDLATGMREIISDADRGAGLLFGYPYAIVVIDNNRAMVASFTNGLVLIDLATGDRSSFSVNPGPSPQGDVALAYDESQDRVLSVGSDSTTEYIQAINLSTGARTVFSSENVGSGDAFLDPSGIAWDARRGRAVVSDVFKVMGVSSGSGNRNVISDNAVGSGENWPQNHFVTSYNDGNQAIYQLATYWLALLDIDKGQREVFFNYSTGSGPDLPFGQIMAFGPNEDILYIKSTSGLVSLSVASGDRALISGDELANGPSMASISDMAVAAAGDRLFAAESDDRFNPTILQIDLATGMRTTFSGPSDGTGPSFVAISGVAIDSAMNRLLVPDHGADVLFAVDLTSGDRAIIADYSPTSPVHLAGVTRIDFDPDSRRAFLLDVNADGPGVYEIDLINGQLAELSGPTRGKGAVFDRPTDFFVDLIHNRALIVHKNGTELLVADLISGDRVLIAR